MSFERKVAFYESKGFDSKAAVLYAREDEEKEKDRQEREREKERQYDLKMKAIEQGNCRNYSCRSFSLIFFR
jgi:hypothetical protein